MQVIADLHGGDPEDASAKSEFQEIKDRVSFDASVSRSRGYYMMLTPSSCSGRLGRHVLTGSCGTGISAGFYSPCPLRHLLNW